MIKHTTRIEIAPENRLHTVYCDQGCDLGSSASQASYEKAVHRAQLHKDIQHYATRDSGLCTGCGVIYNGKRGLRAHQTSKFVSIGCKR